MNNKQTTHIRDEHKAVLDTLLDALSAQQMTPKVIGHAAKSSDYDAIHIGVKLDPTQALKDLSLEPPVFSITRQTYVGGVPYSTHHILKVKGTRFVVSEAQKIYAHSSQDLDWPIF